jgi:hypothetical protein
MLYGLHGVLTKMQTKSIPYTFNRGGYYYFIRSVPSAPFNSYRVSKKARDEIIDKTLDEYTAAMATVKL